MKTIIVLSLFLIPFCLNADFLVCSEEGYQYEPEIGFDGTNFFVVWNDGRGNGSSIYGARITQSGTVLDQGGFKLLNEDDLQSSPCVAFDSTNYIVTWQYGC